MVRFELGNGKTILISMEDYLDMTDEKLQEYLAKDAGIMIDDPFANVNYKEYETREYEIPDTDDIIDPLDDESIEKIKKEINDSDN